MCYFVVKEGGMSLCTSECKHRASPRGFEPGHGDSELKGDSFSSPAAQSPSLAEHSSIGLPRGPNKTPLINGLTNFPLSSADRGRA